MPCSTCKAWDQATGRCRRRAPRPSTPNEAQDTGSSWDCDLTVWPITNEDDHCFEHIPIVEEIAPPPTSSPPVLELWVLTEDDAFPKAYTFPSEEAKQGFLTGVGIFQSMHEVDVFETIGEVVEWARNQLES